MPETFYQIIKNKKKQKVETKELKNKNKKLIMQKRKNTQSKIKPIKIRKQSGTTYYFGCKDYTKNVRPKKIKTINKVLREKSHCVLCRSNKPRFLKQKIN